MAHTDPHAITLHSYGMVFTPAVTVGFVSRDLIDAIMPGMTYIEFTD